MNRYYRPIPRSGPAASAGALQLAGGWCWFDTVEQLERGCAPILRPATELPDDWKHALGAPRADVAGLSLSAPQLMGILNVTPDSFSDGGQFDTHEPALAHAAQMTAQGADILDIGGESTRPGAAFVPMEAEAARVVPVIEHLIGAGQGPISIDTRKASVARAAVGAGAGLINDVSGLMFDPEMAQTVAELGVPVCIMHAQGDPETMQANPRYDDVLLDIYDALEKQINIALRAGIPRAQILVDPGIGFGKTLDHNLQLLRKISLFHGLGCGLLLGVSRKSFIGTIAGEKDAQKRLPGSLAVGLALIAQGVQIVRVHDVAETRQAVDLHLALHSPSLLPKDI